MESHFTATGLVINQAHDKVLMIMHKKLNIWLPAGGHVEPGELPHETVVREVFEETGVKAKIVNMSHTLPLSQTRELQISAPFWVLHEPIGAYKEKPAHWHYDFIYCLIAEQEDICPAEHEVSQVAWFTRDQLHQCDTTEATRSMYCILLDKPSLFHCSI